MKITFSGGAREVGGSCIVVETEDVRVALDYGIKVDEGLSHELPRDLDVVVVSHAHLDHSGNLLTLAGVGVAVIGSSVTHEITMELLRDLIKIHRLRGEPFPYSFQDLHKLSDSWLSRRRVALPGAEILLHQAGHVLGANMIQLKAGGKNLLYTGDFCLHSTEILDGADLEALPKEPDVLVMESTYGGTMRPEREELVKALFGKILETMEGGGNILIPAFAFHRIQEMTRRIDHAMEEGVLPSYNAYYISRLAHRITNYYNVYKSYLCEKLNSQISPFNFSRVRRLRSTRQVKEPAIVICTSGFGHAGASRSLLFKWAENEEDAVIISTGYLPPDSPLSMAKEGELVCDGEIVPVRADVEQIELSGHADHSELVEFVRALKPKRTFLIHGELDQAKALSEKITSYTKVEIPERNESFTI